MRDGGKLPVAAMGLILFFLLVGLCWPEGAQRLRAALTPGDPAVTAVALERFAQDLHSGEQLTQALERMCRTIAVEEEAYEP